MRSLIDWYNSDDETHALVKSSIFCYEFVSIHLSQDGNGRLSRLLSTLLLLKHGYKWIQYVSIEHEIEHRKAEYNRVLRACQAKRPNKVINDWIRFYFDALSNIQTHRKENLMVKELSNYYPQGKNRFWSLFRIIRVVDLDRFHKNWTSLVLL